MLVVAVVAIIVVGPKDLPKMLRSFGKVMGNMRRMAGDFQKQFDDAVREADLDEVKNVASGKGFSPLEDIKKATDKYNRDLKQSIENAGSSDDKPAADAGDDPGAIAGESLPEPAAAPKPASAGKPVKSAPKPSPKPAASSTTTKRSPAKSAAKSGAGNPAKKAPARKPAPKKTAAKKPTPNKAARTKATRAS